MHVDRDSLWYFGEGRGYGKKVDDVIKRFSLLFLLVVGLRSYVLEMFWVTLSHEPSIAQNKHPIAAQAYMFAFAVPVIQISNLLPYNLCSSVSCSILGNRKLTIIVAQEFTRTRPLCCV